ncbi:MAG: hypothetical protein ABSH09_35610 [Bryobacteraceae bacterium]
MAAIFPTRHVGLLPVIGKRHVQNPACALKAFACRQFDPRSDLISITRKIRDGNRNLAFANRLLNGGGRLFAITANETGAAIDHELRCINAIEVVAVHVVLLAR